VDGLNVNIHIEIEGEGVQTAAGTVLADDEGNVRNRIEIEPGVTLVYRSAIEKRMTLAEPEILNLTLQVLGGIQTVEWIANKIVKIAKLVEARHVKVGARQVPTDEEAVAKAIEDEATTIRLIED
jgi:hypothetical protein